MAYVKFIFNGVNVILTPQGENKMKIFVAYRPQRRRDTEQARAYHLGQQRRFDCNKDPPNCWIKKLWEKYQDQ